MSTAVFTLVLLSVTSPAIAQTRQGPAQPAGEATVLTSLVAELEQRNPDLAAARREIDMRVARIAPAGAPPDPTVRVGYMTESLRPPFMPSAGTPGSWGQVGVTQEVPYPGKLSLRSKVAATEADASRWSYEDLRLRLIADLKTAYVEYVLTTRILDIVERNRTALQQFRDIAEARFSVGRASQQDVLRAATELSILIERLAALERDRTVLQAEINRLLYRPADTPLPVAEPAEIGRTDRGVDELRALAAERAPALRRHDREISRGQQALELARKERLPDFGITFSSQKYFEMPWMYGIDFMVTVPVFWQRKQRPMVAEAAASLESANRMRDSTSADVTARVTQEFAALATSRRLQELYSGSVLPQARLTLESSTAAYEVGNVDFLTLLTNFITVLNYEVAHEEQRARSRQALARLESLVGLEFIR